MSETVMDFNIRLAAGFAVWHEMQILLGQEIPSDFMVVWFVEYYRRYEDEMKT
jgi:hypothetical protein